MRRALPLRISLLAFFAYATPAFGSPFESVSDTQVFSGPAHPHPQIIYMSPGALGITPPGQHYYLRGGATFHRFRIQRRILPGTGSELVDGPTVSAGTAAPAFMAAFYSSVGDRGHFGVAVHTPFWENFISNKDALGYHVLGGGFSQTLLSAAGSYKASSRFHFGLGLSIGVSSLELDLLRDTALEAGSDDVRGIGSPCADNQPCGHENPAAAQRLSFKARTRGVSGLFSAENLALSAGIVFRPFGDWWFSLSYVSPPGVISALSIDGAATVVAPSRIGSTVANGRAEVTVRMPQSVHLGARGTAFAGFDAMASVRWQNYSRQRELDIRFFGPEFAARDDIPEWYPRYRGFRDTWRVQAGLERQEGGRLRYGARLRVESGATSGTNLTPLQISPLQVGSALATELRLTENTAIAAHYDMSWFPEAGGDNTRFNPRDRLACVDSGFDFSQCAAAREGRATPTAAGRYQRQTHAVLFSIRYDRL